MPPRHRGSPGAIPGSRTIHAQAERQHAAEFPKLVPRHFQWIVALLQTAIKPRGRSLVMPMEEVDALELRITH